METKSNGFLKVTGILMIIGGSLSIIIGLIAVIGVGALALLLEDANTGLLMFSCLLVLASGIVSLVAGILGVKNAAKPEKAMSCIVCGILAAALSVLGSILNVAGGNNFNVLNLAIGLVLPALYLVGAFQNKKLAG